MPEWNIQQQQLVALQWAARAVETAEGRIDGIGHVQVDRIDNQSRGYGAHRYVWKLDGKQVTKASIWRKSRTL